MNPRSWRWGAPRRHGACPTAGQASVELALVFPVIVLLLLAVVQTGLLVRDYVLTVNAAREAAREASVGAADDRVRGAAKRVLEGVEVEVGRRGRVGDPIEVDARYTSETTLPLVGPVFPDVELHARAVMRLER